MYKFTGIPIHVFFPQFVKITALFRCCNVKNYQKWTRFNLKTSSEVAGIMRFGDYLYFIKIWGFKATRKL